MDESFLLCFSSLVDGGRGYVFPCDRAGAVPLDALSERARNNYLYARAMVGRELAKPEVRRSAAAQAVPSDPARNPAPYRDSGRHDRLRHNDSSVIMASIS